LKLPRSSFSFLAALATGLILAGSVGPAGGQNPNQPALTVLSREGRRALPLSVMNDQEFVFLDDLASLFQLAVREESLGTLTVGYKGRTILLSDQPLASIAGRLVSLPAAPARSGRRWLVPVEFINRALGLVYDSRLDLRKAARLVVVGDLRVPRVTVRFEGGDPARVVIEAAPRSTSTVSQENAAALAIKYDADALEVSIPPVQPQGLIRAIRMVEPTTLAIDLGPRFVSFRSVTETLDDTTRLTVELMSTAREAAPPGPPGPTSPPAPAPDAPDISALSQPAAFRTIVIDPGHGGEDEGVRGSGGAKEKDLVLAAARRIKTTIESRLGIRVLLTRDDDRNVPLDGRTAMANNSKADLLISLHANASFNQGAAGASILYASFGPEQSARSSLGSVRLATFGGGSRDIDLVLWDAAQVHHLDRSAELARLLEAELRQRGTLSGRPIERAPLNVLESANMPAVLIEMGYLTNPAEERRMVGAEFQNTFAQTVYDAVLKFRDLTESGGGR
jgi:N-acetylmuramoyl-L-alanine amidase